MTACSFFFSVYSLSWCRGWGKVSHPICSVFESAAIADYHHSNGSVRSIRERGGGGGVWLCVYCLDVSQPQISSPLFVLFPPERLSDRDCTVHSGIACQARWGERRRSGHVTSSLTLWLGLFTRRGRKRTITVETGEYNEDTRRD